MLTPKIPVAKEGYPFIGLFAFFTLVLAALSCVSGAILLAGITLFVLFFFRDPERFVPDEEDALVSPADGKVIVVEDVDDQRFTNDKAKKISIFMNVFNVHVNRIPISGKVQRILYKPGKFYNADSSMAELENEYCASIIATEKGRQLAVVQIAGRIARRIICWLEPKDSVSTGERFGLIRFGSRVDLYLPAESEIVVKKGDRVQAGESILARLC